MPSTLSPQEKVDRRVKSYLERAAQLYIKVNLESSIRYKSKPEYVIEIAKMLQRGEK